ncbi:hypothetical protein SKAU_G00004340 [Synaphobranchus kaupii]|uniref:Uncharacterized protein n=1 Tax=Synaphobranchus kaupii TaxID=118154 RepID=A0A9Q1G9Z7_SYNKA|nr:hypothetical protein SKAU_G00004340 [Synaphobranchus kaupii]
MADSLTLKNLPALPPELLYCRTAQMICADHMHIAAGREVPIKPQELDWRFLKFISSPAICRRYCGALPGLEEEDDDQSGARRGLT